MRVVHCKQEPYTRYIGRGSIYGNPFTHLPLLNTQALVQVATVEQAVDCYESWLRGSEQLANIEPKRRLAILKSIPFFNNDDVLGCFCRPKHCCHGDVLDKLFQEFRNAALAKAAQLRSGMDV